MRRLSELRMRAPVVVVRVGAALAAGQVDEADLAHRVARLLARALQRELQHPRACAASMSTLNFRLTARHAP